MTKTIIWRLWFIISLISSKWGGGIRHIL